MNDWPLSANVKQLDDIKSLLAALNTAAMVVVLDATFTVLDANPTFCQFHHTDRMMPGMEVLEVLKKIRAESNLRGLPVILQTAKSAPDNTVKGMESGAYCYLTKPFAQSLLLSVLRTAVRDWRQFNELREQLSQDLRNLQLLTRAEFALQTPTEARNLATLLATLCPDPERVVLGLSELLLNAIEHGNLAIGYDLKSGLWSTHDLDHEITRRLSLPEFKDKRVTVTVARITGAWQFTIQDEGQGFDWKKYQDIDPRRVMHHHGRGIAMANLFSFDEIKYESLGNRVRATIYLPTSMPTLPHSCV